MCASRNSVSDFFRTVGRALPGIVCAAILAGQGPPQTVFRVPVRAVAVPVVVQNPAGGFVRNLPPAAFRLFDNDRAQRFQLDYVDQPVAVAVAVETNDAVRAWLPHVRRAASLVEALVVGANGQASLIAFGSSVTSLQSWTRSTESLDAAFAALKPTLDDKSRSLDAVSEAAGQLARLPASFRRVILLISQPGDIGSSARLPDVLRQIEVNNIIVYSLAMPHIGKNLTRKTISIGSPSGVFGGKDTGIMGTVDLAKLVPEIYRDADAAAGRDAVSILAAETGGSRAAFRRLRDYESGLSSIAEELHTEYVLTYTPDSAEPGYHRIRVELARPGLLLRARPGYFNPE
jgi:VWFA-related protein